MFIDPHVHCRDGSQAYKETIAHALHVAKRAGFTAIFDMPNTNPPVTTKEQVLERIELAKQADTGVFYGIHMALTADPEQVKHAVQTYNELEQVVGFKLYAGHSVGEIGVIVDEAQRTVYRTLGDKRYKGVLVLHCEKESMINKWDPSEPITHALNRPWQSEVASVRDQIRYAQEAGYTGKLHIAHISVPEAVRSAKRVPDMAITCGVCPHHLLLDYTAMHKDNGIIMKMNPPLRPPGMNEELLELLRDGMIDWVETDHAPHTLEEKLNDPYMSGITGLQKYPKFILWLTNQGFDLDHIEKITFANIRNAYEFTIDPRICIPTLALEDEYPFDPYDGFSVLD